MGNLYKAWNAEGTADGMLHLLLFEALNSSVPYSVDKMSTMKRHFHLGAVEKLVI